MALARDDPGNAQILEAVEGVGGLQQGGVEMEEGQLAVDY